jgi:hypothetical protein
MDDGFNTEWQETDWAYGLEVTYDYLISGRLGRHLDRGDWNKFWTVGLGMGPEWLRLDASCVLDNDDQLYNRKADEYSFSLHCNLPARFLNW